MTERPVGDRPACWCGNADLGSFSPGYLHCARCETLVWGDMPGPEIARVAADEAGFYARDYWFGHQERDLGYPNIVDRARADLPERCLYWLRALLKYKLPPARVLELGSGPGAFVAVLGAAGFDATGLEISPWVAQFIRDTFGVPALCGPVEDQRIEPASLDAIALMDVLEHLPDPRRTIAHCLTLLKRDGILLVQTPCYPEGARYEELAARRDRFLESLKPTDHLHLFSRRSIRQFMERAGACHVVFESALFAEYDMFLAVSRAPLKALAGAEAVAALAARPAGRIVQALLDLDAARADLSRRYLDSEADRAARLDALQAHGAGRARAEAARNELEAEARTLRDHLEKSEADRAARLEVIERQARQAAEAEAERSRLRSEVAALREHLARAEADRQARLEVIERQGRALGVVEAERNERRAEVAALREHAALIEADRAARLEVIEEQGARLGAAEAERNTLHAEARDLREHAAHAEADRAARLEVIERQSARLSALEAERRALQADAIALREALDRSSAAGARAEALARELSEAHARRDALVAAIVATRAYRVLRLLGRWGWFAGAASMPREAGGSASPPGDRPARGSADEAPRPGKT